MVGRKFVFLAVTVISLFVLIGSASASVAGAYMVDDDQSYNAQPGTPATYGWNQQPWFFFTLPTTAKTYSISWWTPDGASASYDNLEVTSKTSEVWHSLSDWFDQEGSRKAGMWTVHADYSSGAAHGFTPDVTFKVNAAPEPVSSALFLIGGAAMAVRQYRKRGKKS